MVKVMGLCAALSSSTFAAGYCENPCTEVIEINISESRLHNFSNALQSSEPELLFDILKKEEVPNGISVLLRKWCEKQSAEIFEKAGDASQFSQLSVELQSSIEKLKNRLHRCMLTLDLSDCPVGAYYGTLSPYRYILHRNNMTNWPFAAVTA